MSFHKHSPEDFFSFLAGQHTTAIVSHLVCGVKGEERVRGEGARGEQGEVKKGR